MTHNIFNIQRFCINDGPGIRTTVFMKGCMLNCLWCHNPESKSPYPQLMFHQNQCVGCGECFTTCPQQVHILGPQQEHLIQRENCIRCGQCSDGCVGALEMVGKEMTVAEIMAEVRKDLLFYKNSGGGMTVSGGEPLLSPRFTLALLEAAKREGIHTCLETSGCARWQNIQPLLPYTDIFLWDVKETNSELHRRYTGVPNEQIQENLYQLSAAGGKIILRCPIIPGYNDRREHLLAIAALATQLSGVLRVDVEPYHPLGQSKSVDLGQEYPLDNLTFPSNEVVQEWIRTIQSATNKPVQKG